MNSNRVDAVGKIGALAVDAVAGVAALLEELGGDLAELGVAEDVLLLLGPLGALLAECLQLGLQKVGGTAGDDGLVLA